MNTFWLVGMRRYLFTTYYKNNLNLDSKCIKKKEKKIFINVGLSYTQLKLLCYGKS